MESPGADPLVTWDTMHGGLDGDACARASTVGAEHAAPWLGAVPRMGHHCYQPLAVGKWGSPTTPSTLQMARLKLW
eukprot:scaffold149_cov383-Prasinococcus_capsulatus_cf.AAC.9